jgi:serine/threonine protein kinase
VLYALAAVHAQGIVHRDLKPDNVFVTPGGHAKVLDFGIAKLRPDFGSGSVATAAGSMLGTPQYMAPEQALGRAVDARANPYAAGVSPVQGANGRRPFVMAVALRYAPGSTSGAAAAAAPRARARRDASAAGPARRRRRRPAPPPARAAARAGGSGIGPEAAGLRPARLDVDAHLARASSFAHKSVRTRSSS